MKNVNTKEWLKRLHGAHPKKPLPILSFPCVSLLGTTVGKLVCDSALQAQGMKLIADKTDAAAAVSFMDLSIEAECFGATVVFSEDEVPTVKGRLIDDADEADALPIPPMGSGRTGVSLNAVKEACTLITDRPVLAGMIGPFSLAARLFDVSEIMLDCFDDPDMVHTVLEKVTAFLMEYARAFRAAGAHGVMMAEPVAGLLSPALEEEFSSPYIQKIVDAVQDDDFAVLYHNCGDNVPKMLDSILSTGCAAYHFGNAFDLKEDIFPFVPEDTLILGNLDPAGILRMGTPETVREETLALLEKCAAYPNFVLSSGCDIPPQTPWENLESFFAASKEFYGE